ncbi:hypothetical protein GCM10010219_31590 [Streptomyces netropsis]|nr:hypothetical protein GCM10010219_31590 [Streptomyces netropsis]
MQVRPGSEVGLTAPADPHHHRARETAVTFDGTDVHYGRAPPPAALLPHKTARTAFRLPQKSRKVGFSRATARCRATIGHL